MNPIDILGSLLGGGSKGGAADILNDILGGQTRGQSRPNSTSTRPTPTSASDLEDMLGVGQGSTNQPSSRTNTPVHQPPQPRAPQVPVGTQSKQRIPSDIFAPRQRNNQLDLSIRTPVTSPEEQSMSLIRAMINAAKIDGEISEEEQQFIIQQVSDTSSETIQFLRDELSKPLNVREYAGTVPVGLEEKAYLLSLMTMKLDTKEEADYLRSLANLLRLTPDHVNQIHQQQNAPKLYS